MLLLSLADGERPLCRGGDGCETDRGNFEPFDNFISCMVWEAQRDYLRLFTALDR